MTPKDIWILFTNWGRIGQHGGQFQNTPFASADKAEAEFEKIFREKSGNDWAERASFENKPRKYRLVKVDHLRTFRKAELKFNLDSAATSSLSEDLQGCDMVIPFHFLNCSLCSFNNHRLVHVGFTLKLRTLHILSTSSFKHHIECLNSMV